MTSPVQTGSPPVHNSSKDDDHHYRAHNRGSAFDAVFRWVTALAVPVASLLLFRGLYKPISDPDTFWHLRLGDYLSRTWTFVGAEPWSSLAERPLVFHEWAPELLYIAGYRLGGYPTVAWIQAAAGVLFLLTLYVCARRFAPPLLAALVALIGFGGASGSVAARPQVATFILLSLFTMAWLSTAQDKRARWWLIPLTWAWACSHGMWFLGPALGLIVITGMLLDRRVSFREGLRLALVPFLGVGAAALTPVGPRVLVTAGGMRDYTEFVVEWDPPSVFMPQSLFALCLALVLMIFWTRAAGRASWTELGLWGTGVALALMYARTIALGAIILALLAASVLTRHIVVSDVRTPSRRLEALAVSVGVVAVLVLGPVLARADVSGPGGVPRALDDQLAALPAGTVIFNDYALGGWLLWAHPTIDPVIDGRADVYGVQYFNKTVGAYSVSSGWEATVRESGATAALLLSESPLAEGLRTRLGWTTLGSDEGYTLLKAPA